MLLLFAAGEDICSGRVSNKLIFSGLLFGLFCKIGECEAGGIILFLRNISVPVILFFLLFLMHVLGAGDIKLFSMIGGILNIEELFLCIRYSFWIGGIMCVLHLMADKNRLMKLKYACVYVSDLVRCQKLVPYQLPDDIPKSKMAFSIAILLGWICAFCIPLLQ